MIPPTATAERNRPRVRGSPPKRFSLTRGKSAMGMASSVADRSVAIEPHSVGRRSAVSRPPRSVRGPPPAVSVPSGRMAGRRTTASRATVTATAWAAYAAEKPQPHDDQPRQRGTGQHRRLEGDVGQREPGRHLVTRQEPDREGAPGGCAESTATRPQCDQGEQQQHAAVVRQGLRAQPRGGHYLSRGGGPYHRTAVMGVGQRPADQAEQHQRQTGGEPDGARAHRAARQLPDLGQHRHVGRLGAELGGGGADPQVAERLIAPERAGVEERAAGTPPHRGGSVRW